MKKREEDVLGSRKKKKKVKCWPLKNNSGQNRKGGGSMGRRSREGSCKKCSKEAKYEKGEKMRCMGKKILEGRNALNCEGSKQV